MIQVKALAWYLFMLLLAINVSTFGDMSIKNFAYFYLSSKISYYWGYWVQVFWGPVPAGSRGTLRMNGVSERETQWDKTRGLSLKFIFALPLHTQHLFWGKCILLTHRSSQNITATWPSTEIGCQPHTLSFTRVFLIIWPSGLLTFYGLHLVWLKQLQ